MTLLKRAAEGNGIVAKGLRYLGASIGPVSSAVAQFLLWIILLHQLDQSAFGAFSLLLIASQLAGALWSALFCAPLPIMFNASSGAEREQLLASLFSRNLLLALGSTLLFWAMAAPLAVTTLAAILFALFAGISLLRWFA